MCFVFFVFCLYLVVVVVVSLHNFFQRKKVTFAFLGLCLDCVAGWLWRLLQATKCFTV